MGWVCPLMQLSWVRLSARHNPPLRPCTSNAPATLAHPRQKELKDGRYSLLHTTTHVQELKTLLVDRGISTADCLEKADLAKKITETCATVTYFKKR